VLQEDIPGAKLMLFIRTTGRYVIEFTLEIGQIIFFFIDTLKQLFVRPFDIHNTVKQMYVVGVKSLPVVIVTGLFTGMVLALQSYTGFERFGAESLVANVVAMSVTREMGPVLTAFIVAGRAGAAMAAELGTMRVTEQIDALETLATNPIKYLVVPRFLASLLMLPALTIVADIIGILGGFMLTTETFDTSPVLYWKRTWEIIEPYDYNYGLIKSFFFGGSIAIICCYKGFFSEGGAEGVGKATTSAVVFSFMTSIRNK
jgi:phospholipid/cholesterol/gamma-HCH transport system permease protein